MSIDIPDSWPPNLQKDHLFWIFLKDGHTFAFIFPDTSAKKVELTRRFGVLAADPEIPFSWHEAAVMTQRILETR